MILDGALATELQRHGADLRDALWSARTLLEAPQLVRAVHRAYFEAGADLAITASYQATFEGFRRRGIDPVRAAQLLRDSVALAAAARDEFWARQSARAGRLRPLVAASVGPYGAMLADGSEYRGHYGCSDQQLMDFHRPRLAVLAASSADLLACETLPSLQEAVALAQVLAEFPRLRAWMSFSCQDGAHTCEGQPLHECVTRLNEFPQVIAVGVNCTRPEHVSSLLRSIRAYTDKPLLAYPNSGEHYEPVSKQWQGPRSMRAFATQAREWYDEGARLIGGCCGTGPADIRAIKAWSEGVAA